MSLLFPFQTQVVTPAAAEPLPPGTVKDHCRVTHSYDDAYLALLISVARAHVEQLTGRALITQTWDIFYPTFPLEREMRLPYGTLQAVMAFEWTYPDTTTASWTPSGNDLLDSNGTRRAHVDLVSNQPRIMLAFANIWPVGPLKSLWPVRVRARFGYGDADTNVPADIRHAMLMLVEHWYRNREAVVVGQATAIASAPLARAVESLLAPYVLNW